MPDLDLPVARGGYHGLRLEMKTEGAKLSPEQQWWLEQLRRQGYAAELATGAGDAIAKLKWYLGLEAL